MPNKTHLTHPDNRHASACGVPFGGPENTNMTDDRMGGVNCSACLGLPVENGQVQAIPPVDQDRVAMWVKSVLGTQLPGTGMLWPDSDRSRYRVQLLHTDERGILIDVARVEHAAIHPIGQYLIEINVRRPGA